MEEATMTRVASRVGRYIPSQLRLDEHRWDAQRFIPGDNVRSQRQVLIDFIWNVLVSVMKILNEIKRKIISVNVQLLCSVMGCA
jgi:hypothetical protein